MNNEHLSVSQLNQFIKDVVNAGFPQPLWICGEIQGYDRNKFKTHVFFELVEKDPTSQEIVAKIGLVIFANRKLLIENILRKSENAFELKDDIEVKLACKIDFYAPQGAMRLIVESIDPIHTLGKLAQERQKLIAQLKASGVLDKNKQCPLSDVPLNIGLITSDDSAAYNDFMSELKKSGLAFRVHVRNTLMQGKNAPSDVVAALDVMSRFKDLDVVVITRGGGSIADLSCFDSQIIAQKIASMSIPVVSGIGHEINTTITDLAAHTFAKTPTAIAQFLIQRVELFVTQIEQQLDDMSAIVQRKVVSEKDRLKHDVMLLQNATTRFVHAQQTVLLRFEEVLKNQPFSLLKNFSRILKDQMQSLKKTTDSRLTQENQKIKNLDKMVELLHPHNTLKRGFSVTRDSKGNLIRRRKDVKLAMEIVTEVSDGIIRSQVLDNSRVTKSFENK